MIRGLRDTLLVLREVIEGEPAPDLHLLGRAPAGRQDPAIGAAVYVVHDAHGGGDAITVCASRREVDVEFGVLELGAADLAACVGHAVEAKPGANGPPIRAAAGASELPTPKTSARTSSR